LSKPLGRKVRNFSFEVFPPAHFIVVAVPRKKLNLIMYFSHPGCITSDKMPTINGLAVLPSGPSRIRESAGLGFHRSKSHFLNSNTMKRRVSFERNWPLRFGEWRLGVVQSIYGTYWISESAQPEFSHGSDIRLKAELK
jgi:hypothetical protein